MKGIVVISALVLSVVVSAVLFYNKYQGVPDDIDLIEQGLSSISKAIPVQTTLGYISFPEDIEVFGKARYACTPHVITLATERPELDTVITIHKVGNDDSALNIYLSNRQIIYDHTDDKFSYYITTHK